MSYTAKTTTRGNLKSIPFQKLPQIVEDHYDALMVAEKARADGAYRAEILELEKEWNRTHESPNEAGFGDAVKVKLNTRDIRRKSIQEAIRNDWLPTYKLNTILLSVMPQIINYIGSKKINWDEVTTVEGQIDGLKLLKATFNFSDEWDKGLYHFLMLDTRSEYLTTQYKGESKQYCSLVPLILYAFKYHQKINYSQWDVDTLHWVVNWSLHRAMVWDGEIPSREELINARDLGLIIQSGAKAGETRNPISTYRLFATKGGQLEGVPELVGTMLTQIWCAHPANRTPYMILDPHNWDSMPAPLIVENIFAPIIKQSTKIQEDEDMSLPWL